MTYKLSTQTVDTLTWILVKAGASVDTTVIHLLLQLKQTSEHNKDYTTYELELEIILCFIRKPHGS